jgi:hypothetical protein
MCNGALSDLKLSGGIIDQLSTTTSVSLTTKDGMLYMMINS